MQETSEVKRRRERGASMVEFALVGPLFLAFCIAIVDCSFAMVATNTVGASVVDSVRVGAIAADDPDADSKIVSTILDQVWTPGSGIERIVIYQSGRLQADPPSGCMEGTSQAACRVYEVASLDGSALGCPAASDWCPSDRDPDEILGVWVSARYDALSGLTPVDLRWADRATVIIEPTVVG